MKTSEIKVESNIREDLGDLSSLAASIKEQGIIEPLVITKGKRLIAGHRRLAAAKLAGVTEVPVHILVVKDENIEALQLAENLHRKDLTPFEVSEMIGQELRKRGFNLDHDQAIPDGLDEIAGEIAAATGAAKKYVKSMARLAFLPKTFREMLAKDNLTVPQALLILSLPPEGQAKVEKDFYDIRRNIDKPGDKFSMSALEAFIDRVIGKDLKNAPFSLELPYNSLPCIGCQWNTSNTPELFDTGKAGICRKPECYHSKCQAVSTELKGTVAKDAKFVGYAGLDFSGDKPKEIKGLPVVEVSKTQAEKGLKDGTLGFAVIRGKEGRKPEVVHVQLKGKPKKKQEQTRDEIPLLVGAVFRKRRGDLYHEPAKAALSKVPIAKVLALVAQDWKDELEYLGLKPTMENVLLATLFQKAVEHQDEDAEKLLGVSHDKIMEDLTKQIRGITKQLEPVLPKGWSGWDDKVIDAVAQFTKNGKLVLPAVSSPAEQAEDEEENDG